VPNPGDSARVASFIASICLLKTDAMERGCQTFDSLHPLEDFVTPYASEVRHTPK